MIRVMHITARSDPGGGPAVIRTIIEKIGAPIEHHIASPVDPPFGPQFAEIIGRARMVAIPARRFRVAAWRLLANHIRAHDIHILHSHGFGAGLYGRSLAILLQMPVVHSYHGFLIPEHGWRGMLARYCVEAALAPLTTAGIVCAESERAKLRRMLPFPPALLEVVNNGLDPCSSESDPPVRPDPARFSILAVGRLSHQKNPEALIRIASLLGRIEPALDFRFRLVGDGPRRAAAEELARSLDIAHRVEFLGATSAREWLEQADVLLSASRGEGMPLALLEAMAAGLPIVASDVVGNLDLVSHNETGYLFPPRDLARAALALARLANDPELRGRLGAKARQRVQREFTIERFASSFATIYRNVASLHSFDLEESPTP